MSRIGKLPVKVPDKVKVVVEGELVKVEGPKGRTQRILKGVAVKVDKGVVTVTRPDESRASKSLHGLSRTLIANMVKGCSQGFERKLEVFGVGYRAEVKGPKVVFSVGHSHPIEVDLPEGVTAEWKETKAGDKQGEIYVRGVDNDTVGRLVSHMRKLRPPEPYKGKGVKYAEERVRRKQGKTGAA